MKASRLFPIFTIALALVCSCSKEYDEETVVSRPETTVDTETNYAVKAYYTKCEEFLDQLLDYESERGTGELYDVTLPELGILNSIDIETKNGGKIKFSDLSLINQHRFVHETIEYFIQLQSRKAVQIGEASISNKFSKMMKFINFASGLTSEYISGGKSIIEIIDALWVMYGEPNMDNFVEAMEFWVDFFAPTKGVLIGADWASKELTWQEFIQNVGGVAEKGDLFITLPIHNDPLKLLNLTGTSRHHHRLGHSAVCIEDFDANTREGDKIIMGAIEEGVSLEPCPVWFSEFYVLEVQKFIYKWDENALIDPLEITAVPMSKAEKEKFVEFGREYIGTPFIDQKSAHEWLATKTVVPERFTCAAFLWYCAKNVYGIDLSIPILPSIAPAHIVCSPYTRIKKVVQ